MNHKLDAAFDGAAALTAIAAPLWLADAEAWGRALRRISRAGDGHERRWFRRRRSRRDSSDRLDKLPSRPGA